MAFRTFARMKIQSTGVPQPLIGSWISLYNGATGAIPPQASAGSVLTLGTACNAGNDASQLFVNDDEVWLIDPNSSTGANSEAVRVNTITGNTLVFMPSTRFAPNFIGNPFTVNSHVAGAFGSTPGAGTFMLLNYDVNNIFVQPEDGNTAVMYIGSQINFTANFRRIAKLFNVASGSQPIAYSATESSPGNPFRTSELWVIGTANDTYTVSFNVA